MDGRHRIIFFVCACADTPREWTGIYQARDWLQPRTHGVFGCLRCHKSCASRNRNDLTGRYKLLVVITGRYLFSQRDSNPVLM